MWRTPRVRHLIVPHTITLAAREPKARCSSELIKLTGMLPSRVRSTLLDAGGCEVPRLIDLYLWVMRICADHISEHPGRGQMHRRIGGRSRPVFSDKEPKDSGPVLLSLRVGGPNSKGPKGKMEKASPNTRRPTNRCCHPPSAHPDQDTHGIHGAQATHLISRQHFPLGNPTHEWMRAPREAPHSPGPIPGVIKV